MALSSRRMETGVLLPRRPGEGGGPDENKCMAGWSDFIHPASYYRYEVFFSKFTDTSRSRTPYLVGMLALFRPVKLPYHPNIFISVSGGRISSAMALKGGGSITRMGKGHLTQRTSRK